MIFVDGVITVLGVATVVTLVVTTVAAAVVNTSVGTVVGTGMLITVGTSVATAVVVSVVAVAAGFACCVVHPLAAIRSITRINKPIEIFMK